MIPDIVCIWVSLFLAQRPSSATFLLARRCHSTWRNALLGEFHQSELARKSEFLYQMTIS
jgi:hypothetical protein